MAYDGSTMLALKNELRDKILGLKIEKIYQTNDTDIIIQMRGMGEKYRLFISTNATFPRINLTEIDYENPQMPPSFCMLLRKHLQSGVIKDISQHKMDRILFIDIESRSELGDLVIKRLNLEIMGRHSNIILTEDGKIIDSIKRIGPHISRVRSVLPGLEYNFEVISDKINPLDLNSEDFIKILDEAPKGKSIKNTFVNLFTGISNTTARELAERLSIDEDMPLSGLGLNESNGDKIAKFFSDLDHTDKAYLIYNSERKLIDFTSFKRSYYNSSNLEELPSISSAIDKFYFEKSKDINLKNIGSDVLKVVDHNISKLEKKLEKLVIEQEDSKNREKYKVYGDLISSNSYRIEKGEKEVTLENFFDNMNHITIPLDARLSAQENARKFYKTYQKMKVREEVLKPEIENTKNKLLYLNSAKSYLEIAEKKEDIEEIQDELRNFGFIKKKNKKKVKLSKPLEFKTEDGFTIFVGKNSRQNDNLTFKTAGRNDLWFHVKDAPGSHVIIKNDGREFSESAIEYAATLAAKYSSVRYSSNISVDYTEKINVKRHPQKVLGLAIYTDFKTINIKND
ncbi:NFACT RNA binding domain-containing protein [uncultured Peptoniphilus sp.]|uniref:Rqc2 family fibronectin-binding protein n=1 Tax=uncultured Peptoniphilus sp. TaxID=254354 RepID=UPI00280642A9|nr:NFACT RNA binding domain-containing protein [uncultured Peptoniphilus sp.]